MQIIIFQAVNNLIAKDRDVNIVNRTLIKNCLQIFEDFNITTPQIEVVNFEFLWTGEKNLSYAKEWFKTFEKSSIQYVRNKGQNEIGKYSALEYIRTNTTFLSEENERKNYYINKIFHNQIDATNTKYIIMDHLPSLIKVIFR